MDARQFLITGASAGIGAQFARAYARRGHRLVLVARRLERLEALADELAKQYGTRVLCLPADLSQSAAVESLITDLAARGEAIDGLINNAGYSVPRPFAASAWQQEADFIEVCVTTPTRLAYAFLPHMLQQGYGRIINLSSIAAFSGGAAGHTLYPAAKSYMLKFARSLAAEVAHQGIKVTAVCPGSTQSEFYQANGTEGVMASRPMPFVMTADAVVEAAIRGNEAGREVVVPGIVNSLVVAAMTHLDGLVTPLIRQGAKAYLLKD
jgi:uncharacterized protein